MVVVRMGSLASTAELRDTARLLELQLAVFDQKSLVSGGCWLVLFVELVCLQVDACAAVVSC